MDEVIWQPSHPEATRLHEFMQQLPDRPSSYDRLWDWSITNRGDFWQAVRSEEHTSELQSHSFISYAVFCLKKKI